MTVLQQPHPGRSGAARGEKILRRGDDVNGFSSVDTKEDKIYSLTDQVMPKYLRRYRAAVFQQTSLFRLSESARHPA